MTKQTTTLALLLMTFGAFANNIAFDLSSGTFSQNWSDGSLITTNDDWSGVPSIEAYRGDSLASRDTDARTVLADGSATPSDVNANSSVTSFTGGVHEIDSDTIAFQGSGSADAPHLVIYLSSVGVTDINVRYNLRELDSDNAVQQVALHYRTGGSGNWTDVPAAYVPNASDEKGFIPINVTLPAAAENQTDLQLRIMTIDAAGSDSMIGVDDISVSGTLPLSVTITSTTDVTVNGGSDGSATAAVATGIAPYTYAWSNGQSTQTATGLAAGTYTVTATDKVGTRGTASAQINEPTALIATAVVDNNVSVNGGADGQATVSASGAVAPYSFLWSDGQTTQTATGLVASFYGVTVTDANGATASDSVTLTEPTLLVVTATVDNNVSVNGGADGQATVSASGAVAPYSYSWSNGSTTATISGLMAGDYTATVTDSNGAMAMDSVTITEPNAVLTAVAAVDNNVSINGGADGQVSVSASGGAPGYTYLWSNGATTSVVNGLGAGTYSVTVTDSNMDTAVDSVMVSEPTAVLASIITVMDESSPGAGDGSASVQATGGVPPYTYLWSNGATTAAITDLTAGTYTVVVTDANGATSNQVEAAVGNGALVPVPTNAFWAMLILLGMILMFGMRRFRLTA